MIINTISFKTQEIDKTYYLLGAVDEYMGRSYEMKNPNWKGFLLKIHDDDSLQIKRIETREKLLKTSTDNKNTIIKNSENEIVKLQILLDEVMDFKYELENIKTDTNKYE